MTGRCWPGDGEGGTLSVDGTEPGPYYRLAAGDMPVVGTLSDFPLVTNRAVHFAVKAIQKALNRHLHLGLRIDGRFGRMTRNATIAFQQKHLGEPGITAWGGVGPDTSKALFAPLIQRLATTDVPACLLVGQIQNESGFDPGAVGYADDRDLGLLQINGHYHPDMTEADRFSPIIAIEYAVTLYEANLFQLAGNLRDAVVAYNLGVGGARTWIRNGRPDVADWYSPSRDIRGYVDRILGGCT